MKEENVDKILRVIGIIDDQEKENNRKEVDEEKENDTSAGVKKADIDEKMELESTKSIGYTFQEEDEPISEPYDNLNENEQLYLNDKPTTSLSNPGPQDESDLEAFINESYKNKTVQDEKETVLISF